MPKKPLEKWKVGLIAFFVVAVIVILVILLSILLQSEEVEAGICVTIAQLTPAFSQGSALVLSCASAAAYEDNSVQIRNTLKHCCLKGSFHNIERFRDRSTDTSGFGATFQDSNAPTFSVLIAFKGSKNFTDLETDFASFSMVPFPDARFPGAMVGNGFFSAWESVKEDVIRYINSALARQNQRISSLWITGHSLGGALSTLCATTVRFLYPFLQINVYTFASPRTGNAAFVTIFNNLSNVNSVRIANSGDIIPYLPPESDGFQQVGVLTLLRRNEDGTASCIVNSSQPPPPTNLLLFIFNHQLTTYQSLLLQCIAQGG